MGEKGSFEIATNGVEDLAHRTELALRQTTEENEVPTESKIARGPLFELEDKAIKDKAKSTRVKNDKVDKVRIGHDRVDLAETPKGKGQSRHESTKRLDPMLGGASDKTPSEGSNNTHHPTKRIEELEPKTTALESSICGLC